MKSHMGLKHLDLLLPIYTEILEVIRDSSIKLKVLKEYNSQLNIPNHPLSKAIIYNNLVVNFTGVITICIMDVSIILKNISRTKNKWEKALYFRQGSLVVYEFINVYYKQNKIIAPILKSEFPDIYKLYSAESIKLREFKKLYKYDSELQILRNNTIAHINENIFDYCYFISKIHPPKLRKCFTEFLHFLMHFEKMQMQIGNKLTNDILAIEGKNLDDYIKNEYPLAPLKKLKIPKMLK